jgi:cytochrome c
MKAKGGRRKAKGLCFRCAGVIPHPSSLILRAGAVALLVAALAAGCGGPEAITAVPGDPKAGHAALERYQCGACHAIPGVAGATGLVGPPLSGYRKRVYLAGKFPQEPALLAKWIQDAPSLAPQTAMPNVGVTEADAVNIAAYLYQLR